MSPAMTLTLGGAEVALVAALLPRQRRARHRVHRHRGSGRRTALPSAQWRLPTVSLPVPVSVPQRPAPVRHVGKGRHRRPTRLASWSAPADRRRHAGDLGLGLLALICALLVASCLR